MLGWSIRARACRSASKRAITWRLSMPGLDELQRDLASDRLGLLGHVDHAHAALADLLEQLVWADNRTGQLGRRGRGHRGGRRSGRGFEEAPGVLVNLEKGFDSLPSCRIVAARVL